MTDDGIAKARELFLEFMGNKMQMARENCLEDYQSCDIFLETERKWVSEFSRRAIEKFKISKLVEVGLSRAVWATVKYNCRKDFLCFSEFVYGNIDSLDTYGKLLLSRKLLDVKNIPDKEFSLEINDLLVFVIDSLGREKKVTVDQRYIDKQLIPKSLNNKRELLKGVNAMKEIVSTFR